MAGCSVVFPDRSAPKSASYSITPPGEPWRSVPVGEDPGSVQALRADLAYEDTRTGAIISLNSLCRKYTNVSLEEMSRNLVIGIKSRNTIRERFFELQGSRAKDTILEGVVDGVKVRIRTVVTRRNFCTYDFIYVATPDNFERSLVGFDTFLASFVVDQ